MHFLIWITYEYDELISTFRFYVLITERSLDSVNEILIWKVQSCFFGLSLSIFIGSIIRIDHWGHSAKYRYRLADKTTKTKVRFICCFETLENQDKNEFNQILEYMPISLF